jgi:hypothetical protein
MDKVQKLYTNIFHTKYIRENNIDTNLILKFYICFSRLEFAIKAEGIHIYKNSNVTVNWVSLFQNFEEKIISSFGQGILGNRIVKTQTWNGEKVIFSERDTENLTKLEIIKHNFISIRNNLFHGGKDINASNEELACDQELIDVGLSLIEFFIQLNYSYQHEF